MAEQTTAPVQPQPAPAADVAPAPTQAPVEETKPVGGHEGSGEVATPIENAADQPAPKAEPVPEKYELTLGKDSLLKPERLGEIESFAKTHNLTNKQAQELVARDEAGMKAMHEAQVAHHKSQVEAWTKASQADPEFGGEKLAASAEIAKRALTKYGSESLTKYLDETGLGNHPEVIRVFHKIGQAMSEGRVVSGGAATQQQIAIEDKFYGKKK